MRAGGAGGRPGFFYWHCACQREHERNAGAIARDFRDYQSETGAEVDTEDEFGDKPDVEKFVPQDYEDWIAPVSTARTYSEFLSMMEMDNDTVALTIYTLVSNGITGARNAHMKRQAENIANKSSSK